MMAVSVLLVPQFTGTKWVNYLIYNAIVLTVATVILRVLRFVLGRALTKSSEQLKVDPTKYHFLKNGLDFVIFLGAIILILYSIPELKNLGVSLFASAGIIAAIIGFASQEAFSNIVSRIFIVIFKPFRVDDRIQVGTLVMGRVEDIALRHTVVRNFENRRFVIPNSVISREIILNSTIVDEKLANFVQIGISYDPYIDRAMDLMREECMAHPLLIDNRSQEDKDKGIPVVVIKVISLSESSVDLRATCWTKNLTDGFELRTDLLKSIKQRFDREGIEVPFPHRTIVMKKDGKVA
jgi:small-conductance mechanosensitive channel